jgi:hypothetical protein
VPDERSSSMTVERSVRPAALVIVIVLHASVLLVSQTRTRSGDVSRASVWLDLDVRSVDEDVVRAPEAPSAEAVSVGPEAALAQHAPTIAPPDIAPPAAATDWSLSGGIAGQAAIEDLVRREGYRSLGPRAQQADATGGAPSIYTTPKHKLGDVEPDPLNYDRVWLSDRCYIELGKPVTPRADAREGFPNIPKCMFGIGKKEPRGDLFEHLKRDQKEKE